MLRISSDAQHACVIIQLILCHEPAVAYIDPDRHRLFRVLLVVGDGVDKSVFVLFEICCICIRLKIKQTSAGSEGNEVLLLHHYSVEVTGLDRRDEHLKIIIVCPGIGRGVEIAGIVKKHILFGQVISPLTHELFHELALDTGLGLYVDKSHIEPVFLVAEQ